MGLAASPSVPFPTFSHQPNKQKLLGVLPKLQYCEVKDGRIAFLISGNCMKFSSRKQY